MFDHIILGTLWYARPILFWFPSSQPSSQAFLTLSTTELLMFYKIISSHSFIHLFNRLSKTNLVISSVQFSHLVVSDCLRHHGLQYARLPCSSLTPGACSNSCSLSRCCHPTISSSAIPFSSFHLQSFPASGSLWISSSHQVAKVLEFQLQQQTFQWLFRTDFL